MEGKHLRSTLCAHLPTHTDDSSLTDYHHPSLGDYILIPIEQIHSTQPPHIKNIKY